MQVPLTSGIDQVIEIERQLLRSQEDFVICNDFAEPEFSLFDMRFSAWLRSRELDSGERLGTQCIAADDSTDVSKPVCTGGYKIFAVLRI